jgi:antitoxin VapB
LHNYASCHLEEQSDEKSFIEISYKISPGVHPAYAGVEMTNWSLCKALQQGDFLMNTAKIFINGRSQAIRLPKEYRFKDDEVYINKIDDIVVIMPKNKKMASLMNIINKFTDDFMDERNQPAVQVRENFQ